MNLKAPAAQLKTDLPAVFLALKDPDMPLSAKLLAALTVAYALSPIDLIPDCIPVLGYVDDLLLLPALTALTIRLIPADVLERSRAASAELWADGKPNKWYFAIPILLLWAAVLLLLIRFAVKLRK